MAGSDQKTQFAQEVPPEVARLTNRPQQAGAPPPGGAQGGAPPGAPPSAAPQARTMMAQAPQLPQQPVPAQALPAAARTMMAQAPQLPSAPPPGASPPGASPPSAASLPNTVAPGGFAQGLPPSPAAAPGGPRPAAGHMGQGGASMSVSAPGARPVANPLPLRPASAVFAGGGAAAPGPSPVVMRFVLGPALGLLVAVFTLIVSNRVWPPATGSGGRGPEFLAAKNRVQIITAPAGATVFVNGVPLTDKTPTYVEGPVGKKAQVKIALAGFESREVVVPFTKDERPPLRVTLFRPGQGPVKEKVQDQELYDDRPGTKTVREPEDDDEQKGPAEKAEKEPDKGKKEKLAAAKAPEEEEEQVEAKKEKEGGQAAIEPEGKKGKKGKRVKIERAEPGEKAEKAEKPEKAVAVPKGKALLTVLVRPWAIVYVDGRKLKQTPIRDLPLSPGKHTLLLVNDNKGKRENVPLTLGAGATQSISRNWE